MFLDPAQTVDMSLLRLVEELTGYRENWEWIEGQIEKNRQYGLTPETIFNDCMIRLIARAISVAYPKVRFTYTYPHGGVPVLWADNRQFATLSEFYMATQRYALERLEKKSAEQRSKETATENKPEQADESQTIESKE